MLLRELAGAGTSGSWAGALAASGRRDLLRSRALEERGADAGVGGLVDDLMAAAITDQDRRVEVRAEVLEAIRRADRHVDRRVLGRVEPDALGLFVGQLDLGAGEAPEW
jgi:hypothetical protein